MAQTKFFSREEARAIADRVLGFATAEQARVNIWSGAEGNTRFAVNQISTAGDIANAQLVVTSSFGRRVASATSNRFDDESLRRVVETSERLARLVPEDPEYLGELEAQQYPEARAFFESTAGLGPEARARAVMEVTSRARNRDLVSTGFLPYQAGSQAVATSRGLFAYNQTTQANFTTTVRTPDGTGSGWAGSGAHDWSQVNTRELGERAIEKAERSRNPRAVEPGRWTVVLEPTAVANLVSLMMFSLAARTADEGRSFFSRQGGGNRLGERFLDERVSIYTDPSDPNLFSTPFTSEGLGNRRTQWVENGTLQNLVYDRFWAQRQGKEATGFPAGYYMAGGDATLEEMIASTQRGLLVTRFWYIRSVDPRTILFTGLTRDGTFLIENGRVTTAVKNLRWNETPIFMLNNIEMMGRPTRVSASESGDIGPAVMVPPLKARDFTFTSLSDAV
ncbi:MAG: TldD/PmbA family protein [Gemmatimonadetes bacterium]|nr:TldD/PmbA family protein [Gemmatimonadota bacterium]